MNLFAPVQSGLRRRRRHALLTGACGLCLAAPAWGAPGEPSQIEALRGYSLEELAQIEVTSVSRHAEPLSEAPAAIYVITGEDIRRSGATSLPEALRLAPNLQVGRDTASQYAVSARGFNSLETANKLLVLIDGRSVYAPLHAGVFWDEEHVLLEDVERIEVISGPGGTLYGANAVNGVINIITKSAEDTQGGAARVTYGPLDKTATVRYGGKLGDTGAFRVYAKGFDYANTYFAASDDDALDDYDGLTGGFRADWEFGTNRLTLQGDIFDDHIRGGDLSGGNILGRWTRSMWGGTTTAQAYYDRSKRSDFLLLDEADTADISIQHSRPVGRRHQLVLGGGYRTVSDTFRAPGPFTLSPESDDQQLANLFIQDEIALTESVSLTLGSKFEHSSYSGFEYLPNIRLAWAPDETALLWAAVSRAVRTPVRLDRDLMAQGIFIGGPEFDSEQLTAYEAGYRGQPTDRTSLSVSVFLNDYDDLRNTALSPGGGFPAQFLNQLEGQTYGVEAWGDFQATDWWRLSIGAAALEKDFELELGATNLADPPSTGNDPSYQIMLRSQMTLGERGSLDARLRHVDDLPSPAVPAYTELNARLGYYITERIELSIAGVNLLDKSHPETSAVAAPQEIRRGVHIGLRWGF